MDEVWSRRTPLSLELSVGLSPVDAVSHPPPKESELHTSRCSPKRARDTQQASELEEKLTKMNEENKRLSEMLDQYIEKYMTLRNKIVDRTDCFSPSEDQQNVASPAKRRKIENDLTMNFNGNSGSERIDEAFQNDSPSSQETYMKFQEEIKPKFTKIVMQPDPADSSLIEENRKANRKVKLEFASSVVFLGLSELLCIMFLPKNSVNENILKAVSILGFLAIIAGFCLLIHTLFMFAPSNTFTRPIHHNISKGLIIISCPTLLASLMPLLLLPSPYNLLIPIVLAAVLLTLCIHLYLRLKTNDEETEKDQTQYEEHMKEIPRLSELSQGVVSLSSGGLIGLLFGIHTNASNHAHHPVVSASVFLSFTSFILSICLVLLCQMRLMHLSSSTRKNFLRVGAGLCKFLLVLLAFSALAIASTFLQWYTVMVFIPVLIVYAIWLSIELCTKDPHNIQDTLGEEEAKLAYTKGNKVTSISFGGITAIFSGYLGSNGKNMHLNICMIFMASAFVSGQILILLSYKPSTRSHTGLVVSILGYFAISLLVFGVFTIFILDLV